MQCVRAWRYIADIPVNKYHTVLQVRANKDQYINSSKAN